MSATKVRFKTMIFETLRLSGLPRLLTSSLGGVGAIIAMHRVREPSDDPFQPNRSLEVTPAFLDRTLEHLRKLDVDIISLDDTKSRLETGRFDKRFVCFTLDDGYADNYLEALPVFEAYDAPFSIYLTTGFVDRTAYFWWMIIEEVIRDNDEVTLRLDGQEKRLPTRSLEQKHQAFEIWHQVFRSLDGDDVERVARRVCHDFGIDAASLCAEHAMTWDMARDLTEKGLGTIEAHTARHLALSRLRPEDIKVEMVRSSARITEMTGRAPRHFAYPYGDADAVTSRDRALLAKLPIATATTTHADILRPEHAASLTALPRITLNGYYQCEGYLDLMLSGLPSALSRN